MLRLSLGAECPAGYTSENLDCGSMKVETLWSTNCKRCVPQQAGTYATSDSDCIGIIQRYLADRGLLTAPQVTSVWGPETERALDVGVPGWRSMAGGACGILLNLGLSPSPVSNFFSNMTSGSNTGLLVAGGIGLLILFVVLSKNKSASSTPASVVVTQGTK